MYKINERTKRCLEATVGMPYDDIVKLDFEDEMNYVNKKTGKKLRFSGKQHSDRMGRGNPLIATGRIRTMEEVDKRIKGLK